MFSFAGIQTDDEISANLMPSINYKKHIRDRLLCGAQATMRGDDCGRAATLVLNRELMTRSTETHETSLKDGFPLVLFRGSQGGLADHSS